MENYTENISDELKDKIINFLNIHNTPIIDYWSWREAQNLIVEIGREIIKNNEKFEQEFDEIIKNYTDNRKSDELNAYELQLINEVNKQLKSLYERYKQNDEIQKLLKQLLLKKYQ